MKTKFRILTIFIALGLLFAIASPAISAVVSTNGEFNATQDSIFLNYTNAYSQNITFWSNASYDVFVNISNSSTAIAANYSQSNSQTACQQPNIVFFVGSAANRINIFAVGNNTNLTLSFNNMLSCLPGRYWGGFVIKNSTNASENITINAAVDIPISASNYNALSQTGTTGAIAAAMPGNASAFHRYYFNASEINRSTAVTINMSAAQDLDVFLFDGSTPARLLARSVNKSGSNEWLTFWPLTPNAMYEIRIFGNITNASSTAYTFYTIFSTLNATYTADAGQPASNMSFGSLNTSQKNIQNITLKNEGNITMDNVTESKELYYAKRWTNNNSASAGGFDGHFLVPSFATKIKVAVNWTDTAQNYTIHLTAPNRTVIGFSNEKYVNANATNASLEEYFETTAITQGYWNVSVRNRTASYSNYTLSALVWYPASEWITTNYTAMTFNRTGNANSTAAINITLNASSNSIDGNYEGFIQYAAARGAALRIPFSASVNTSTLVVNNTIGSAALRIDENIGANLTKVLNITLNNTGSYPLSFYIENSTSALSSGSNFINFTYQAPASPLLAGANHQLNMTFYLDPNTTRNNTGVYEGFIRFVTNDSRPYQNFTMTLRVNLTNDLNVVISQMGSWDGDLNWINNTNVSEIFNATLNVYYINSIDTEINSLNTTNFTAWLTSANVSYRIPSSGTLAIANGTNPIYTGSPSKYTLNVTMPAGQPGGVYQLHVGANYSRGDNITFKGEGVYNYLYVNNSGLSMSTSSSTSISIANTSTSTFYANVSNYGNLAGSSATIQFSESCSGYSVAANSSTGCASASGSGDTWTVTAAANSNSCMVWWTITAGSSAAGACTANIIGAGSGNTWYDTRGINVSVTVTASSSSTTTTTTTTSTTSNTTTVAANTTPEISITSYPSETKITQNSSASISIKVKNSGYTNLTGVKVYVDGINQSWYAIPGAQDINKGVEKNYSIIFSIPASAPVATYAIKYVANNSAAGRSASASLVILPSNTTSVQIVANLSNYTQKYQQLHLLLNQTKLKIVNSTNLTDAEASLGKAKDLLDKANAYMKAGDYFNAYQLAGQIDSLLNAAEAMISQANQSADKQAGNSLIWLIAVAAVIAVAGFVAYLALPPKHGFSPEIGYKYAHPEVRGKSNLEIAKKKAKEILERVKNTIKKRQQPKPYAYKEPNPPASFSYKGPAIKD